MSGAQGAAVRDSLKYATPDGYFVYPYPFTNDVWQAPDHDYEDPYDKTRNPLGEAARANFEILDASVPLDGSWFMFRANNQALFDGDVVVQVWFDTVGDGSGEPAQRTEATHLVAVDISALTAGEEARDVADGIIAALDDAFLPGGSGSDIADVDVTRAANGADDGDIVTMVHDINVPLSAGNIFGRRVNPTRYNLPIIASEDIAGEADTQINWAGGGSQFPQEFNGAQNSADWPAIFGQNFGLLPQDGRYPPWASEIGG